jgi:hypothetical protein
MTDSLHHRQYGREPPSAAIMGLLVKDKANEG